MSMASAVVQFIGQISRPDECATEIEYRHQGMCNFAEVSNGEGEGGGTCVSIVYYSLGHHLSLDFLLISRKEHSALYSIEVDSINTY